MARKAYYSSITSRQWAAIYAIQRNLGVKFQGKTMADAGKFIGRYKDLSITCRQKGELTNEDASVLLFK